MHVLSFLDPLEDPFEMRKPWSETFATARPLRCHS